MTDRDADFNLDAEIDGEPPCLDRMARGALIRLNRAVLSGRASEASSWLRIWRTLKAEAAAAAEQPPADAALETKAADPVAEPLTSLADCTRELLSLRTDVTRADPRDRRAVRGLQARIDRVAARAAAFGIEDLPPRSASPSPPLAVLMPVAATDHPDVGLGA